MRFAQLLVSAFAAYVAVRAAFIFVGTAGAALVGIALSVAAYWAWRRPVRPIAAGLLLGAAASAVALAL